MRYRMINRLTREKILNSDEFKKMSSFTFEDILENIQKLDSIGGLIRGVPHRFLCLVQKMEAISLREEIAVGILGDLVPVENDEVKFSTKEFRGDVRVIAALLLYLRLSIHSNEYKSLMKSFLLDFRRIPYVDEYNIKTFIYLDVFVDDLLGKSRVLNIHLNGELGI